MSGCFFPRLRSELQFPAPLRLGLPEKAARPPLPRPSVTKPRPGVEKSSLTNIPDFAVGALLYPLPRGGRGENTSGGGWAGCAPKWGQQGQARRGWAVPLQSPAAASGGVARAQPPPWVGWLPGRGRRGGGAGGAAEDCPFLPRDI